MVCSWAWEQHPASADLLPALLKPPSRPALFYKRSPCAWGSPLRGFIACMTLLPAMSQAFYWVRWLGEECLNCGWNGSRRLERGWGGGCWTPSLGGVFWSLAGKPLLCWDEPLLPAGRLWLPGCGKGGIGPSSGPDRAWHPGVRDKADEKPGETERNVPLASGPRALCYLPRWDRARFVRPASNFSPPWPGLVSSTPVGGLNCRACPAPPLLSAC